MLPIEEYKSHCNSLMSVTHHDGVQIRVNVPTRCIRLCRDMVVALKLQKVSMTGHESRWVSGSG